LREVSAKAIAALFAFQPRTATALCQRWVAEGFLVVTDASQKAEQKATAEKDRKTQNLTDFETAKKSTI